MSPIEDQLIETWRVHNRVHLYLLDAIASEHLCDAIGAKHRSVFQLFAHLHNVRLMWLEPSGPDLVKGLAKIAAKAGDKGLLAGSLQASGEAIERLLRAGLVAGRVKGFKPHAVAFLGYLIAHESHHRGQVASALKGSGHALDRKTSYGMWEWGVR